MFIRSLLASVILLTTATAQAHEYRAGALQIDHPWSRAVPPMAKVAGAFMNINNQGDEEDALLGARTPLAEQVEIHQSMMEGDMMQMRQLPALPIPAHGDVTLKPGSYHLMLINLTGQPREGDRFPLTLQFEKAGKVEVEIAVESAVKKDAHAGMHH
ncbi:copper chaperone PCu(A)C [Zobellella maritima]|uniref:copper chaperone PCu(A)C n=1 Tax=Zobellella maritima TaxID=2059725 RepID=UPI000E3018F9|nr:copper chaperone PCu(A)C [Zobellella maritima]